MKSIVSIMGQTFTELEVTLMVLSVFLVLVINLLLFSRMRLKAQIEGMHQEYREKIHSLRNLLQEAQGHVSMWNRRFAEDRRNYASRPNVPSPGSQARRSSLAFKDIRPKDSDDDLQIRSLLAAKDSARLNRSVRVQGSHSAHVDNVSFGVDSSPWGRGSASYDNCSSSGNNSSQSSSDSSSDSYSSSDSSCSSSSSD